MKDSKAKYVWIAAIAFFCEVLIATKFSGFNHVRGSLSDFLVVIFLYFLVKVFWDGPSCPLALSILGFACAVEISQHFHLADALGLRRGGLASILLGNTFSLLDILMYLAGTVVAYLFDTFFIRKPAPRSA